MKRLLGLIYIHAALINHGDFGVNRYVTFFLILVSLNNAYGAQFSDLKMESDSLQNYKFSEAEKNRIEGLLNQYLEHHKKADPMQCSLGVSRHSVETISVGESKKKVEKNNTNENELPWIHISSSAGEAEPIENIQSNPTGGVQLVESFELWRKQVIEDKNTHLKSQTTAGLVYVIEIPEFLTRALIVKVILDTFPNLNEKDIIFAQDFADFGSAARSIGQAIYERPELLKNRGSVEANTQKIQSELEEYYSPNSKSEFLSICGTPMDAREIAAQERVKFEYDELAFQCKNRSHQKKKLSEKKTTQKTPIDVVPAEKKSDPPPPHSVEKRRHSLHDRENPRTPHFRPVHFVSIRMRKFRVPLREHRWNKCFFKTKGE